MKNIFLFILFNISIIISINYDKDHSESLNKAWKLIHTNDCTIPNFITILPIFYLRRFKKIWTLSKNDKLEDCKSIWKETREFINQLPKILQNKFINFVDKEENDKANGNFILELLPEERQFFEKTLRNVSMAMEKKIEILSVWGNERLSTSALGDFNKFLESIAKKDKRFSEKIDKLSPEAKKAYRQIIELQKHKQKLFESFSNDVKNELVNLWKHDTIRKSKNLLLEKEALTIDDGIC
uniref:SXP/RAL-2 family protein Ani s 5-like cation-binding domain-containing protein n=1 Tax=Strongyloides stercoralis TaxID=6248 RepID=A0A0K0E2G4_STRER